MKHGLSTEIVWRNADNTQRTWRGRCGKHAEWTGPTYEYVEDEWRKHYHAETGIVPKAMGGQENRWQPDDETTAPRNPAADTAAAPTLARIP